MGSLDITLYRDDLTNISEMPKVKNDQLDLEVKGKKVIIVDDVLYTCRTAEQLLML